MKKTLLLIALMLGSFVHAQDYNSYLAEATKAFDDGMYRKAYDSSTKAIALNDSNIDDDRRPGLSQFLPVLKHMLTPIIP